MLFSSAFPGMFNTFVRWQFQRTYDAMLAAPVDVEELITAEMLWISMRAGVYGLAPLLVAIAFGLSPKRACCSCLDRLRDGLRLRRVRRAVAAVAKTIDNFNYVTSAVLTPMFLVAGTFFPISTLPHGAARGRRSSTRSTTACSSCATPRSARCALADLGHAAVLIAFALLMWRWRSGSSASA